MPNDYIAALFALILAATTGATATEQADRGEQTQLVAPPPPAVVVQYAPDGLDDCDEMNWYRIDAGLPERFSGIGWRESNCRNEDAVRTSCCHGYWQMHMMHFNGSGVIYGVYCGAYSYHDVNSDTPEDKKRQACAAKALHDEVGISAWSATA